MRQPIYVILASLFLAAPATAQTAPAPASAPAKPVQPTATASSPANVQGAKPADASQQSSKDDSMANYDVNGSNASDAMGGSSH